MKENKIIFMSPADGPEKANITSEISDTQIFNGVEYTQDQIKVFREKFDLLIDNLVQFEENLPLVNTTNAAKLFKDYNQLREEHFITIYKDIQNIEEYHVIQQLERHLMYISEEIIKKLWENEYNSKINNTITFEQYNDFIEKMKSKGVKNIETIDQRAYPNDYLKNQINSTTDWTDEKIYQYISSSGFFKYGPKIINTFFWDYEISHVNGAPINPKPLYNHLYPQEAILRIFKHLYKVVKDNKNISESVKLELKNKSEAISMTSISQTKLSPESIKIREEYRDKIDQMIYEVEKAKKETSQGYTQNFDIAVEGFHKEIENILLNLDGETAEESIVNKMVRQTVMNLDEVPLSDMKLFTRDYIHYIQTKLINKTWVDPELYKKLVQKSTRGDTIPKFGTINFPREDNETLEDETSTELISSTSTQDSISEDTALELVDGNNNEESILETTDISDNIDFIETNSEWTESRFINEDREFLEDAVSKHLELKKYVSTADISEKAKKELEEKLSVDEMNIIAAENAIKLKVVKNAIDQYPSGEFSEHSDNNKRIILQNYLKMIDEDHMKIILVQYKEMLLETRKTIKQYLQPLMYTLTVNKEAVESLNAENYKEDEQMFKPLNDGSNLLFSNAMTNPDESSEKILYPKQKREYQQLKFIEELIFAEIRNIEEDRTWGEWAQQAFVEWGDDTPERYRNVKSMLDTVKEASIAIDTQFMEYPEGDFSLSTFLKEKSSFKRNFKDTFGSRNFNNFVNTSIDSDDDVYKLAAKYFSFTRGIREYDSGRAMIESCLQNEFKSAITKVPEERRSELYQKAKSDAIYAFYRAKTHENVRKQTKIQAETHNKEIENYNFNARQTGEREIPLLNEADIENAIQKSITLSKEALIDSYFQKSLHKEAIASNYFEVSKLNPLQKKLHDQYKDSLGVEEGGWSDETCDFLTDLLVKELPLAIASVTVAGAVARVAGAGVRSLASVTTSLARGRSAIQTSIAVGRISNGYRLLNIAVKGTEIAVAGSVFTVMNYQLHRHLNAPHFFEQDTSKWVQELMVGIAVWGLFEGAFSAVKYLKGGDSARALEKLARSGDDALRAQVQGINNAKIGFALTKGEIRTLKQAAESGTKSLDDALSKLVKEGKITDTMKSKVLEAAAKESDEALKSVFQELNKLHNVDDLIMHRLDQALRSGKPGAVDDVLAEMKNAVVEPSTITKITESYAKSGKEGVKKTLDDLLQQGKIDSSMHKALMKASKSPEMMAKRIGALRNMKLYDDVASTLKSSYKGVQSMQNRFLKYANGPRSVFREHPKLKGIYEALVLDLHFEAAAMFLGGVIHEGVVQGDLALYAHQDLMTTLTQTYTTAVAFRMSFSGIHATQKYIKPHPLLDVLMPPKTRKEWKENYSENGQFIGGERFIELSKAEPAKALEMMKDSSSVPIDHEGLLIVAEHIRVNHGKEMAQEYVAQVFARLQPWQRKVLSERLSIESGKAGSFEFLTPGVKELLTTEKMTKALESEAPPVNQGSQTMTRLANTPRAVRAAVLTVAIMGGTLTPSQSMAKPIEPSRVEISISGAKKANTDSSYIAFEAGKSRQASKEVDRADIFNHSQKEIFEGIEQRANKPDAKTIQNMKDWYANNLSSQLRNNMRISIDSNNNPIIIVNNEALKAESGLDFSIADVSSQFDKIQTQEVGSDRKEAPIAKEDGSIVDAETGELLYTPEEVDSLWQQLTFNYGSFENHSVQNAKDKATWILITLGLLGTFGSASFFMAAGFAGRKFAQLQAGLLKKASSMKGVEFVKLESKDLKSLNELLGEIKRENGVLEGDKLFDLNSSNTRKLSDLQKQIKKEFVKFEFLESTNGIEYYQDLLTFFLVNFKLKELDIKYNEATSKDAKIEIVKDIARLQEIKGKLLENLITNSPMYKGPNKLSEPLKKSIDSTLKELGLKRPERELVFEVVDKILINTNVVNAKSREIKFTQQQRRLLEPKRQKAQETLEKVDRAEEVSNRTKEDIKIERESLKDEYTLAKEILKEGKKKESEETVKKHEEMIEKQKKLEQYTELRGDAADAYLQAKEAQSKGEELNPTQTETINKYEEILIELGFNPNSRDFSYTKTVERVTQDAWYDKLKTEVESYDYTAKEVEYQKANELLLKFESAENTIKEYEKLQDMETNYEQYQKEHEYWESEKGQLEVHEHQNILELAETLRTKESELTGDKNKAVKNLITIRTFLTSNPQARWLGNAVQKVLLYGAALSPVGATLSYLSHDQDGPTDPQEVLDAHEDIQPNTGEQLKEDDDKEKVEEIHYNDDEAENILEESLKRERIRKEREKLNTNDSTSQDNNTSSPDSAPQDNSITPKEGEYTIEEANDALDDLLK